jgi:hypothetical protein
MPVGDLRWATGTLVGSKSTLMYLTKCVWWAARPTQAKDGAISKCDIILDLTGGSSLFPQQKTRRISACRKSQPAVSQAIFAASQMVGTCAALRAIEPTLCAYRCRKTSLLELPERLPRLGPSCPPERLSH